MYLDPTLWQLNADGGSIAFTQWILVHISGPLESYYVKKIYDVATLETLTRR